MTLRKILLFLTFALCQSVFAQQGLSPASVKVWDAARDGDATALAAALADGGSVDVVSASGIPALVVAIRSGKANVVAVLLDAGAAGINESYLVAKKRTKPIAIATWQGNVDVVRTLLARGASLMADNGDAWRGALVAESLETVQVFLDAGADSNYRFADGESPVTVTALRGNLAILKALLASKSCGGCRNDQGTTPLMYAAAWGRESIVELLIEQGVPLYPVNTNRLTAYVAAQQNKDLESRARISALLLKQGALKQAQNRAIDEQLLQAAYAGDVARLKELLNKGADVGVRGIPNTTLWLRDALSASAKHPAACKLLLERGANPHARDDAGFTALHTAASDGSAECIKLLVEHGAEPNVVARHGQTPLYMAVNSSKATNVAALLNAGADPNNSDESLLSIAQDRKMTKIEQLLKDGGAK